MEFTKFIRFALTASLFDQVHKEAKQRKISASELIRRALERYLYEDDQRRRILGVPPAHPLSLLNTPLGYWTPAEEEFRA
jgi:Arc/MetJ-type ribon-helix-helix transcriptional regulator